VSFQQVEVASRESVKGLADKVASLGSVVNVVRVRRTWHLRTACLRSIPLGSAVVSEEFEQVIAQGGSGLIVSTMARHTRPSLPNEQDLLVADELLAFPFLGKEVVPNSMVAYIKSRGRITRVQASNMSWESVCPRSPISRRIVLTPLALHELNSPLGDIHRAMINVSPAKCMAWPDDLAVAANYTLRSDAVLSRVGNC